MKRYISILACFIVGVTLAQNGQDVIQLPGIGNRTIEPAYRMIESPKIIDTTITTNVVEYPLLVYAIFPPLPTAIALETSNTYTSLSG